MEKQSQVKWQSISSLPHQPFPTLKNIYGYLKYSETTIVSVTSFTTTSAKTKKYLRLLKEFKNYSIKYRVKSLSLKEKLPVCSSVIIISENENRFFALKWLQCSKE
ncbi:MULTISPECIES: hypothetical protein [unclassified Desulfurobacterium]|uniref:hypothetical protein n=1 Tax=Desulfurobacterium sp. TC5-1 TaxID=1158318 RepID=UPI0018CB81C3|nr:hypothetical protein [Desulfurobacterium sp. TC5-1]